MSKTVKLNDGRIIKLNVSQDENEYFIYAKDENNRQIGSCVFSIWLLYSRVFTDDERVKYANRFRINLANAPYEHIVKRKKMLEEYNYEGASAALIKKYKHKTSVCKLRSIDVLEKDFIGKGVGSIMLEEAERIAGENNCKEISAMYLPSGPFQDKSRSFYIRNGFQFEHEGGITYVKKSLLEHNIEVDNG